MNPVTWLREMWQDIRHPGWGGGTVIRGPLQAGETMGPFIVDCDLGGPSAVASGGEGTASDLSSAATPDAPCGAAPGGCGHFMCGYVIGSSSITDAMVERVARELHAALRKPDEPTMVWSGHYLTLARRLLDVASR